MAGRFQLRNPSSGKVLIDSEFIRFGLVKSGTMTPLMVSGITEDYSFTVKAICPIVYITGAAVLSYSTKGAGDNWTFRYRGWPNMPSYSQVHSPPIPGRTTANMPHPKFYVFDFMRPNKSGRGLWVRNPVTKETTFNSDQPPLNVRLKIQSPPPVTTGTYRKPYLSPGGQWQRRVFDGSPWLTTAGNAEQVAVPVTALGLPSNRTWAAFSPWRRGAQYSGSYDDFTVLETIACLDGYIGWGWTLDPQTTWSELPGDGLGAWGANAKRPSITLMDVTDLPFPFDY